MRPKSLRGKVSLYLFIALTGAMALFTLLILQHRQEDLQREISRHVMQVSEVIVRSIRNAMLVNEPEIAEKIIEDIAQKKGIERVRVIDADGMIVHSNHSAEIMEIIEQQDEPCVHCHQTGEPLTQVPDDTRWTIFETPYGYRTLSTMQPIRNEPTCSTALCHDPGQSVLGIVDVSYSLEDIDRSMKEHALQIMGISVGFILVFSVGIGFLLHRLIYLPLRDLESGTEKMSSGSLDHVIPVRSDDEFGHVAGSFNEMTKALNKSRSEMNELIHTLESKVEERTQELLIAEAEVAHGEKLASIGLLTSGIAHELNNPLTGVLTFTSLLRKKMQDGSEDAEDMDLVIRETKRCASIIRRLLDFAREKVPVKGYYSINQLIEDTVRFVERPASLQQIRITMDLDPELPLVWCDSDLIEQVVLNILVNAQQAIEGEGEIQIMTRSSMRPPSKKTGVERLPMVEITIRDTGCGIPEADLQRIFDPFFTSKEVGKGTGLGLSVSHGIIKSHAGEIKVESVVGMGTTFRVYLPIKSTSDDVACIADGVSQ